MNTNKKLAMRLANIMPTPENATEWAIPSKEAIQNYILDELRSICFANWYDQILKDIKQLLIVLKEAIVLRKSSKHKIHISRVKISPLVEEIFNSACKSIGWRVQYTTDKIKIFPYQPNIEVDGRRMIAECYFMQYANKFDIPQRMQKWHMEYRKALLVI